MCLFADQDSVMLYGQGTI